MKNDALMRSDSWEASSAALEVRIACPCTALEVSTRKGGPGWPPFCRVSAPDEHESTIAIRTSAPTEASQRRTSWYGTCAPFSRNPSSSEWPE